MQAKIRVFFVILLMLPALYAQAATSQEANTKTKVVSNLELNAEAKAALNKLYQEKPAAKTLGTKAKGILVFPSIIKGGAIVGAEYGKGVLFIGKDNAGKNKVSGYYNTMSASVGFQLGVQERAQVIMFMTDASLKKFQKSENWTAGVDGSVAIAKFGAGGEINNQTAKKPIIGFIIDNKGLMYNLTLEGSKISKVS